jgi:hypothetical protein
MIQGQPQEPQQPREDTRKLQAGPPMTLLIE